MSTSHNHNTAFDHYAHERDSYFYWKLRTTFSLNMTTVYVLQMTSQKWRSSDDVDNPVWQHWITIIVPEVILTDTAYLWVEGGNIGDPIPNAVSPELVSLAKSTGAVAIKLSGVPNQPLVFSDECRSRSEDALAAYSFDRFLNTGDPAWPFTIPMAKSVVRCMDTCQSFIAEHFSTGVAIEHFILSGGSKRALAVWLAAAIDKRVVGVVPIVLEWFNIAAQIRHQRRVYGSSLDIWNDFNQFRVFEHFDTQRGQELLQLIDPYSFVDRYTMPKFILTASGCEFFTPDASQFYFSDLPGDKFFRCVPNADHKLRGSDALYSVSVFCNSILGDSTRQRYSWFMESDGNIRLETPDLPSKVVLWQATNSTRDFRLRTIGSKWTSSTVLLHQPGVYRSEMSKPNEGWVAYFLELQYDVGLGKVCKFTTEVRIEPDKLPYSVSM